MNRYYELLKIVTDLHFEAALVDDAEFKSQLRELADQLSNLTKHYLKGKN